MRIVFLASLALAVVGGAGSLRAQGTTMDAQTLTQAAFDRVPGADLNNPNRALTDRTVPNGTRNRIAVTNTLAPPPTGRSTRAAATRKEINRLEAKRERYVREHSSRTEEAKPLRPTPELNGPQLYSLDAVTPTPAPSATPVTTAGSTVTTRKKADAKFFQTTDGRELKRLREESSRGEASTLAPRP